MKKFAVSVARFIFVFMDVILASLITRAIFGPQMIAMNVAASLALMAGTLSFISCMITYHTDGEMIIDERNKESIKWYFELKSDPYNISKKTRVVFDIKPYSDSSRE